MSATNSAYSTWCAVDSPRPFREWILLNSKDHPPDWWEKIFEVDVMLSPVCVRVSRSAWEPFLFRWTGSCPMSLAIPRLVRFAYLEIHSRSAVFPREDVIPKWLWQTNYINLEIRSRVTVLFREDVCQNDCAVCTWSSSLVRTILLVPNGRTESWTVRISRSARDSPSSLVRTWCQRCL